MSSCERPPNSSASDLVPSTVSKLYSFSTGTQGSSRRFRASSSPRRVSSFSSPSSSSRAACHSSCVPTFCCVIALPPISARVPLSSRCFVQIGSSSVRVCLRGHHRGGWEQLRPWLTAYRRRNQSTVRLTGVDIWVPRLVGVNVRVAEWRLLTATHNLLKLHKHQLATA